MNMLLHAGALDRDLCLQEASKATRAKHSVKVMRRQIKRRERAAWRADLHEPNDRQATEAYEDRTRILDHISDTYWHGVHEPSVVYFVTSLHNPGLYRLDQLRKAA
jgi:hypothetical protein